MQLKVFNEINFLPALKAFFSDLRVPINYITESSTSARNILTETYKENDSFNLIDEVFVVGMVDDAAFKGNKSLEIDKIKSDYDGILIFGLTLNERPNNSLPTRAHLAEISRAFNREFYYTPVIIVFKYNNETSNFLAFSNTERLKYKQEWREGEKAGKVSLLRDIDIKTPHSGHERILSELAIPLPRVSQIDSFEKLYLYWQEVFNVNILNKKFYREISDWYFWAIKNVTFPGAPTATDAHNKNAKLNELLQEHKATNVIRLLTRLLFVWFIKEKKLIPEELFELQTLQQDILNEISPYHESGMFTQANKDSVYYKAILQNLFFATLNCPIETDSLDKRQRGFRGDGYGTHRGIDYLMRYKNFFKNPEKFLKMMNETVPFLNGGLFECLDDKFNNIYIDGFSDQMAKGEQLVVPDYLFFGIEEKVDLSSEYGINNKGTKEAAVKGLINILKSYKFTITENTPIEEDVALDPELLGKVFENLLASYNPETKTTARKQTGSFYTPREIVNSMVDESLIKYLKNAVGETSLSDFEGSLRRLSSFDNNTPFEDDKHLRKLIIQALSKCKILDPACGSGAFPMGALQKMVHILQKLDSNNEIWKEVQLKNAKIDTDEAFEIEDKKAREERLLEINEAFDQSINDSDYARKLFILENCIYGVDIQPIATQISKLRFFISLVVEQKVIAGKENFGIRPLPNLETKFVAANTLIGIEKPQDGKTFNIFDSGELKILEKRLHKTRSKLFSARTKETKLKYRQLDEDLRKTISDELVRSNWPNETATQLSSWDPYDQNNHSAFFDSEWMFDIKDGFDIIIGNPPYGAKFNLLEKKYIKSKYISMEGDFESYIYFIERGIDMLSKRGLLSFIVPNNFLMQWFSSKIRKIILQKKILQIVDLGFNVFESAVVPTAIILIENGNPVGNSVQFKNQNDNLQDGYFNVIMQNEFFKLPNYQFNLSLTPTNLFIYRELLKDSTPLELTAEIKIGIECKPEFIFSEKLSESHKPLVRGRNFERYITYFENDPKYVNYDRPLLHRPREERLFLASPKILIRQTGDRIIAAIDYEQLYAWKSVFVVLLHNSKLDMKYLLGLLNSSSLNYFYNLIVGETGRTFAQVKGVNIEQLPIKHVEPKRQWPIIKLVEIITFLKQNPQKISSSLFEEVLDAAVIELYFEEHLKEKDLAVFDDISFDISNVLENLNLNELDDQKIISVIETLYKSWSNPDNKMRNRIKLFAVRSPEILKLILENK